jgi:uncharacterized protein (DUF1800 family)
MSSKTNTFFSPPPGGGPIKPYTGAFGQKQLMHLLRRTMFGVSTPDLKAFQGKTMAQVVDALLNVPAAAPAPPVKNYSSTVSEDKPLFDPITGLPKKDAQGNILYEQAKDPATGKLLFDTNGKPIYVKWPVGSDTFDTANDNASNPKYSKWTGLKMGDTWTTYRYNPIDKINSDGTRRASLKFWWSKLILEQDRTIREKMTLFLHNHLATEMVDVNNANLSYNHVALLRKYAVGNFKKLIYDVTLDPGMLVYLNGNTNDGSKASSVNENYGRELQELFTVGKGPNSGYTEDDVKAAARVLSGWDINMRQDTPDVTKPNNKNDILDPTVPYKSFFVPSRHDITDKQFSVFYGNKVIKGRNTVTAGTEEITELIDMIFSVDEVSKFIIRKLFVFFVYSKIDADIETNVIEPLAELFRTSKFELKPVLKALFTSEYFYKNEYVGAMIKSPIDYIFGHLRMLQVALPSDPLAFEAQYNMAAVVYSMARNQSQDLGDPPNVSGWAAYYQAPLFYEVWLDSSTVQSRVVSRVLNKLSTGSAFVNSQSRNLTVNFDFLRLVLETSSPNDINIAISDLATLLYPIPISQATKDRVKTAFFNSATLGAKTEANWTTGINALIANPATTDKNGVAVKDNMSKLFNLMFFAGEYQLH